MKKLALKLYLVLSIALMLTAASWFTWSNSCQDIHQVSREGAIYTGMCAGDGIQYVGVFVVCVLAALIYVLITAFIFKMLGDRPDRYY